MQLAGFAGCKGQPGDITAPGAQTCVKLKRILTGKPLASFPIARRCTAHRASTPLGEMGLSNGWTTRRIDTAAKVSVPSRGNGVIDCTVTRSEATSRCSSFRPLSGRLTNLMRDLVMDYGVFPSPLGEMGLSIGIVVADRAGNVYVSVPSRGNGVID